jgi:hypothetical protein
LCWIHVVRWRMRQAKPLEVFRWHNLLFLGGHH